MPDPVAMTWDAQGQRKFETGVDHGVLFIYDSANNTYGSGIAWNGLVSVNETPSGAEPTKLWADNIKYATLMSAEEYSFTIEAYMAPAEFAACDGQASYGGGKIGQQPRSMFAFSYRTKVGSDTLGTNAGYKIHYVFGCLASPSEMNHQTVNDSPEAQTMSWTVNSTPITVGSGSSAKTFSTLVIDDPDGTYDNSTLPSLS